MKIYGAWRGRSGWGSAFLNIGYVSIMELEAGGCVHLVEEEKQKVQKECCGKGLTYTTRGYSSAGPDNQRILGVRGDLEHVSAVNEKGPLA